VKLRPGIRLGPYEIVALLGAGGMGEVYRARDTRLGRDVAIKVLPTEFAADPDRLRRFEQEARATAALDHPNILAVYDVGTLDGAPYIVEQLLEGESLRGRLERGPLSVREAVGTAIQIAEGLAAAHAKGIVHRDLKPANVFITSEGPVKILDFGIAKLAPPRSAEELAQAATVVDATEAGTILGTLAYMSPEQVLGKSVDARSDLFALGVVLHEMLSGARPFQRDSAPETMAAILNEESPDLAEAGKGIPPGLARIVRHCLEKRPEDRVQSARDLAFDLALLSQPFDTAARAVAPMRPAPRRVVRLALAGAAALVLLVVGALLLHRKPQEASETTFQRFTFRRGRLDAARFLPDEQTVVYSAAWDGKPSEVFSVRLDSLDSRPLGHPGVALLAVSPASELALLQPIESTSHFSIGTLAIASPSGESPRPTEEHVGFADWSRDGSAMVIARQIETGFQLEYPPGTVLCRTGGWFSHPRVSTGGDRVAFLHHPSGSTDGSVEVVDRRGTRRTLAGPYVHVEGLAWSPRGDEVWFNATTIAKEPLKGFFSTTMEGKVRLLLSQPSPRQLQDVARDGRALVSFNEYIQPLLYYGPSASAPRDLSWIHNSLVNDLSPDGRTVLFIADETTTGSASWWFYVRQTDGAPPVRLHVGSPGAMRFSPDGDHVLISQVDPGAIYVYPVGPGRSSVVRLDGFAVRSAGMFRDGSTVWFSGYEAGKPARVWLTDLKGTKPRAATPEGVAGRVTPDGRYVISQQGKVVQLWPLAGGAPTAVKGVLAGERVLGWSASGEFFVAATAGGVVPIKIVRVEPQTGKRELVREIVPPDLAGYIGSSLAVSADGRSVALTPSQRLAQLYVVEGLR